MKTQHLTFEDLTGYISHTLDDAHRESLDAHLAHCPMCRANLAEQELRQRQVSNELSAVLKAAALPSQMQFSAIQPRLQTRNTRNNLWSRWNALMPTALALLGVMLAFLGLWQVIGVKAFSTPPQSLSALPTLACFFLVLASVQQFDHSHSIQPRTTLIWVAALILWVGSALIGSLDLLALRDLAIIITVRIGGSGALASPVAMLAVYVGTVLYIGLVIGGGEYHYRHLGQPSSWKLFTITILGQLFILILPYLII